MRRNLIFTIGVLAFGLNVLALEGCADKPAQRVCPLLVPWSATDQLALAADLKASKSLLIHRAVQEDAGYREWARKCQGVR